MSFEHAPISKGIIIQFSFTRDINLRVCTGLMMTCAATSIAVGIFDVKHYLHLQV